MEEKLLVSNRLSKERVKLENQLRKEYQRRDKARQVTMSDLEEEVKECSNLKYISRLDLEKHIFIKCDKCLKDCDMCVYREVRNDLIGANTTPKWVARMLIKFGNCYVANKLNAREIKELEELIGAKLVLSKPLMIKGGYVLGVVDK